MPLFSPFILITLSALALFITLSIQRAHLLSLLLTLETITLMLISLTILWAKKSLMIAVLVILSLGACEASIGLCLLVLMSRTSGTLMVKALNLNKT